MYLRREFSLSHLVIDECLSLYYWLLLILQLITIYSIDNVYCSILVFVLHGHGRVSSSISKLMHMLITHAAAVSVSVSVPATLLFVYIR